MEQSIEVELESQDFNDSFSVKSEVKTILLQINRYMTKFVKLYNDKREKRDVIEVVKRMVNPVYVGLVDKFYSIVDQKGEVPDRKEDQRLRKQLESEIIKNKSEGELYKKRKKDLEEIKKKFNEKKTELLSGVQIPMIEEEKGRIKQEIEDELDLVKKIDDNEFADIEITKEEVSKAQNQLLEAEKNGSQNEKKINILKDQITNGGFLNRIILRCYVCRRLLKECHFFYSSLCKSCGDLNYKIREMKINLTGRVAIVTGARVKIGYYTALQLLRFNCQVIATTRFPKDCLMRYQKEPDFDTFKHLLRVYPLDLRMFPCIDKFIAFVEENYSHVDILINNAAQTVRRSGDFYNYLLEIESQKLPEDLEKMVVKTNMEKFNSQGFLSEESFHVNEPNDGITNSNTNNNLTSGNKSGSIMLQEKLPESVLMSQMDPLKESTKTIHDPTIMGYDNQPIDFSAKTSWSLQLDEINFFEFAEVQIINSWAPFYIIKKLKNLMIKSPFPDKYVVNATGLEGTYAQKSSAHPHTNMAKASLNMLTYTSGKYYKRFGIYMNCVDTGWVSCMQEFGSLYGDSPYNNEDFEKIFTHVPLDDMDGAMRLIQPIIEGVEYKNFLSGCLLKNYKVYEF